MRNIEGIIQEFVIGGFFSGPHGVDSVIVGHFRGTDLVYDARVRKRLPLGGRNSAGGQKMSADCVGVAHGREYIGYYESGGEGGI
jgi:hypothetical protein